MQVSEDGLWVWNGTEWVPNENAETAQASEPVVEQVSEPEVAAAPAMAEPAMAAAPAMQAQAMPMQAKRLLASCFKRSRCWQKMPQHCHPHCCGHRCHNNKCQCLFLCKSW